MCTPDMTLQTACKACLNEVLCASSATSAGAQAVTNLEAQWTCATPRIDWNICIIHTITNGEHILQVITSRTSRLLFVKGPVPLENSAFNKVSSKHCLGSRTGGSRCDFLS